VKNADWWFDFISPYAYLQSERLDRFDGRVELRLRPVLFAGLLAHHGHKGPAEIPGKREHTYRQVAWLAHREGIALAFPPSHPFNPLPLLRLFIAAGGGRDALHAIFRFVWRDGRLSDDAAAFGRLAASLGLGDPDDPGALDAALSAPAVKARLRESTDAAIAQGVFGVPTLCVDGQQFWGFDATAMALAWLDGDAFMHGEAMRRAAALPHGVQRRA
jgi:2-hydroxychromene-2-carboxylate isomerase